MVHKDNIPPSTRAALAHPRWFTVSCMMGPMAIVPTPLPAVTIPFARPMRLKKIGKKKKKSLKALVYSFYSTGIYDDLFLSH